VVWGEKHGAAFVLAAHQSQHFERQQPFGREFFDRSVSFLQRHHVVDSLGLRFTWATRVFCHIRPPTRVSSPTHSSSSVATQPRKMRQSSTSRARVPGVAPPAHPWGAPSSRSASATGRRMVMSPAWKRYSFSSAKVRPRALPGRSRLLAAADLAQQLRLAPGRGPQRWPRVGTARTSTWVGTGNRPQWIAVAGRTGTSPVVAGSAPDQPARRRWE